jgi:ketosteroid isomerase-like protein
MERRGSNKMALSIMSPEEVVRAFFNAYNNGSLEGAMKWLADDFVSRKASTNWDPINKASFRDMLERFAFAFPDFRWQTRHMVLSGDTVAVDAIGTGTFMRPWVRPDRTHQPTGRGYRGETCIFLRVNEDGLIQEHTHYAGADFLKEYSGAGMKVAA